MSKRTQEYSLDPNVDEIPEDDFEAVAVAVTDAIEGFKASVNQIMDTAPTGENMKPIVENIERLYSPDSALQRLIDSGIVTATDSTISWREGHLEHVAHLYVSDPVRATSAVTDAVHRRSH